MKRLFSIISAVCLGLMIYACDGEGGSAPITWEECAVSYSLLEYFPKYDGDIENAAYFNDSGGESVMFCDYNVNRDNVEAFKDKLRSSGFNEEPLTGDTAYWFNYTGTYKLKVVIDDFETFVIIELTILP